MLAGWGNANDSALAANSQRSDESLNDLNVPCGVDGDVDTDAVSEFRKNLDQVFA